jgi:hypothetical protein
MRDYNGGLIYQQNEHFNALKSTLGHLAPPYDLLLEKFFYALAPAHMRSVLEVDALKTFFLMLIQFLKKEQGLSIKSDYLTKEEPRRAYAIYSSLDPAMKRKTEEAIEKLDLPSHKLISFSIETFDLPCTGYLFLSDDKEKKKAFLEIFSSDMVLTS